MPIVVRHDNYGGQAQLAQNAGQFATDRALNLEQLRQQQFAEEQARAQASFALGGIGQAFQQNLALQDRAYQQQQDAFRQQLQRDQFGASQRQNLAENDYRRAALDAQLQRANIGADSRERIAGMNNDTRQSIASDNNDTRYGLAQMKMLADQERDRINNEYKAAIAAANNEADAQQITLKYQKQWEANDAKQRWLAQENEKDRQNQLARTSMGVQGAAERQNAMLGMRQQQFDTTRQDRLNQQGAAGAYQNYNAQLNNYRAQVGNLNYQRVGLESMIQNIQRDQSITDEAARASQIAPLARQLGQVMQQIQQMQGQVPSVPMVPPPMSPQQQQPQYSPADVYNATQDAGSSIIGGAIESAPPPPTPQTVQAAIQIAAQVRSMAPAGTTKEQLKQMIIDAVAAKGINPNAVAGIRLQR